MTPSVDDLVLGAFVQAAERMTDTGLRGPDLRERKHLDPLVKDAFELASGRRPISRRFESEAFPGVGAIDVVADRPMVFIELKWSYEPPGKIFESVWDAIKLAVLGPEHGRDHLYVATGASEEEWSRSECRALFATGEVNPVEMWERPLVPKRTPNWGATVGEDLVIGGRGNQPARGPKSLRVHLLDSLPVADDFRLKLIRVEGETELRDWPQLTTLSGVP